jgi:chromosome segregation ATPase
VSEYFTNLEDEHAALKLSTRRGITTLNKEHDLALELKQTKPNQVSGQLVAAESAHAVTIETKDRKEDSSQDLDAAKADEQSLQSRLKEAETKLSTKEKELRDMADCAETKTAELIRTCRKRDILSECC